MAPDLSPDAIRAASFRTVIRGADPKEVEKFLAELADRVTELQQQNERLNSRLGELADRDLKSEFETVGREVTAVLESAREASESIRERASLDAARWRSEAMAETEKMRKEARNDSEALRADAWAVGSEMLSQAMAEAERISQRAERESLTITGEAERDALRLVSQARREAEDHARSATMDAEKLTADASKARDAMIEQARREAEASQERTRALEQRREELLGELEGVRATLSQLEGTLEAKREDLNLSRMSDTSVRVIPSDSPPRPVMDPATTHWEPGETVRVIRTEDDPPPEVEEADEEPIDDIPAEPLEPKTPPEPAETEGAGKPEPAPPEEHVSGKDGDDVGALFASLRQPGAGPLGAAAATVDQPAQSAKEPSRPTKPARVVDADTVIEERDTDLLPITNRALRGVKKAVTEAQNVALDGLRTDSDWAPDGSDISETVKADLIGLWTESYTAGHDAAQQMAGEKLKRPKTPKTDFPEEFGNDLAAAIEAELVESGDGQRERQTAASKVFRAWRTDEAERRIRQLALRGFNQGLAESSDGRELIWAPSGTPCGACRKAAEDPRASLPPVHPGCECAIAV